MLPVKHQPVDSGNCIACHFGHSSKEDKLLTDVPIALCKDCHPQEHKLSHPVGYREIGGERKMVVDPRTKKMLTCASCHQVHGSQNKYLTPKDWRRELCTECHKF
jgi:predicted CXXCH cytochrome family protein